MWIVGVGITVAILYGFSKFAGLVDREQKELEAERRESRTVSRQK